MKYPAGCINKGRATAKVYVNEYISKGSVCLCCVPSYTRADAVRSRSPIEDLAGEGRTEKGRNYVNYRQGRSWFRQK